MNLSKDVGREYTASEVDELVQAVADEYKVDVEDVSIDIAYEVTGSFAVENVDPSQANVIEETIKNSISQETGVPTTDIDVKYNSNTGVIEYTVKSDSYDKSNDIKDSVIDDSFTDTIQNDLDIVDSNIIVTSPQVNDSITADINIVVDGEDIIDMDDATNALSNELTQDGFTVDKAEGTQIIRCNSVGFFVCFT